MKPSKPNSDQQAAEGAASAEAVQEEIPLDLLCDIAWRIASARNALPADKVAWYRCVSEANDLIRAAIEVLQLEQHELKTKRYEKHAERELSSLLTEEEHIGDHVSFKRGCQLVTGVKDANDAEARFRRACARGFLMVDGDTFADFETNGFHSSDLPALRVRYLGVDKRELRKEYELSGKFVKKQK
jgi:hypothetical protein